MLADLTVKDFLDKVAGNDPVPGGGSIAALGGALASALATMVTRLTIGKKGYEASEEVMQHAPVSYTHLDVYKRQTLTCKQGLANIFCSFHIFVSRP